MDNGIKGMFVHGGALNILQGDKIFSVRDNGKEPNEWPVLHFANIGASELWVEYFLVEMPELIDVGALRQEERAEAKEAIARVAIEGLLPAFEDLKAIRQSVTVPTPAMNLRKHYEDLAIHSWKAYKALLPKATKLLGFDIGFIFTAGKSKKTFEDSLAAFLNLHPLLPVGFADNLRNNIFGWQEKLAGFRNNHAEHPGDNPDGTYDWFYDPAVAEWYFKAVWTMSSDLLFLFISYRISHLIYLEEIAPEEQNVNRRRRFRYAH